MYMHERRVDVCKAYIVYIIIRCERARYATAAYKHLIIASAGHVYKYYIYFRFFGPPPPNLHTETIVVRDRVYVFTTFC